MRRWTLLAALLAAPSVFAQPFTLAKGSTEVTLSASIWRIDSFFDGQGDDKQLEDLGIAVTQVDLILQVEHGLSDHLTFIASLPYSRSELDVLGSDDDGPMSVNDGASDARIGLKWRLSGDGATQYGLRIGLKWPGDYQTDLVYAPGDGNFDAEALLSAGRRLGKLTVSADAGYRYRNGAPHDEIVVRVEPSVLLGSRLTLFGTGDWVDSRGGIGIDETVGVAWPFTQTEEDLLRLTAGSLWSFSPRFSLFAIWGATVDGRSTARGSQWTVGTKLSF
jgi:hypothetical protein